MRVQFAFLYLKHLIQYRIYLWTFLAVSIQCKNVWRFLGEWINLYHDYMANSSVSRQQLLNYFFREKLARLYGKQTDVKAVQNEFSVSERRAYLVLGLCI